MREIYLCRHGETEWSLSGQHTGTTDLPLTETGKKQAIALGTRLKNIHFSKVICSPKQRAEQTCRLAGLSPTFDPDLVEWNYGNYEGKTSQEIDPHWNLFTDGAPGGESPAQVGARADQILSRYKDDTLAIFSHGHFSRVLAARWLGLPPSSGALFLLSVASLSILSHEHGRPVIKLWNSIS